MNTFGYIAKAIGPQDVLVTLLNNLKVQERQNRVCTTVAIAIVAETCSPFTVLPALMNEYKVSTCTAKVCTMLAADGKQQHPLLYPHHLMCPVCNTFLTGSSLDPILCCNFRTRAQDNPATQNLMPSAPRPPGTGAECAEWRAQGPVVPV